MKEKNEAIVKLSPSRLLIRIYGFNTMKIKEARATVRVIINYIMSEPVRDAFDRWCYAKHRRPHFHSFDVCWQCVGRWRGQRARRRRGARAAVRRVRPRPSHAAPRCTGAPHALLCCTAAPRTTARRRRRSLTTAYSPTDGLLHHCLRPVSPAHKHVSYACPVCVCAFHNALDSIRDSFVYLHSTPRRFAS